MNCSLVCPLVAEDLRLACFIYFMENVTSVLRHYGGRRKRDLLSEVSMKQKRPDRYSPHYSLSITETSVMSKPIF